MKLQIKNSQLADAINIRGLKAKLSKKKADGSEENETLAHDLEQSQDLAVQNDQSSSNPSEDQKKTSESHKSKSKASPGVKKTKEDFEQTQKNHADEFYEEPTFSTLNTEAHHSAPSSPLPNVVVPTFVSEKEQITTRQETKDELKSAVEKDVIPETKAQSLAGAKKEEATEQKAPLFFSAARKNPDQLGPVLDRPERPVSSQPAPRKAPPSRPFEGRKSEEDRYNGPREDRYNGPRPDSLRPDSSRPDSSRPDRFRSPQQMRGAPPRDNRDSRPPRDGNSFRNHDGNRDGNRERPPYAGPRTGQPRGPTGGYGASSSDQRSGGFQGPRQNNGGFSSQGGPSSGGNRPYPNRQGQGGGAPFGRRSDSSSGGGGFKPQPFVSKPYPDSGPFKKGLDLDKAPPQKEGVEDRAQRRQMLFQESEEKRSKFKDVKEGKTTFKKTEDRFTEARFRQGFQSSDDEDEKGGSTAWKKKRSSKSHTKIEIQEPTRPTKIKVRLPVSIKDLAQEMKLKASQLIAKLFLQGIIVTLNDLLDDETIIQVLGQEFGCEVGIDTSEQEKLRIVGKTIREEIEGDTSSQLILRPPVIAFMGHVDHGKTSLIDAIRKTNRVQSEAGAITQHIGAFGCSTSHGPVTILDTPGHEAFSAMRERGAEITDIVVLVVAGDEGMKPQTIEALNQAKAAHSTMVVAINKCDKPTFDQEKVYRQLADQELLPEAWGGQTITVNCSAVTGEGIQDLIEMVALQSEVLELKANPTVRARGSVIESEMHKGLGPVATVLVQNGSLKLGDCIVFDFNWAKIKSMKDDSGRDIFIAGPSQPVRINGLSGFPEAGEEFVVVESEKEARSISEARQEGKRQLAFQTKKKFTLDSLAQKGGIQKKVLNLILRADVQGSLEALKTALMKIESNKVEINIVLTGVGEVSESDVQLANASKSTIVGFHTQVESHAEPMIKELGVQLRLHDIIYHAQDDVRELMKSLLDKIPQENDKGKAEVRAIFKSSQLGIISGCQVTDGVITRNCFIRIVRKGEVIHKASVASLKRFKDDVKEVSKGTECGILLSGFSDYQVGDIFEAYEVTYLTQDL